MWGLVSKLFAGEFPWQPWISFAIFFRILTSGFEQCGENVASFNITLVVGFGLMVCGLTFPKGLSTLGDSFSSSYVDMVPFDSTCTQVGFDFISFQLCSSSP